MSVPSCVTISCSLSEANYVRGYDLFKSQNYDLVGGTGSFFEKNRLLSEKWNGMLPGEKAVYKGMADADNQKRKDIGSVESLIGSGMDKSSSLSKRRKTHQTFARRTVLKTLDAMQKDDIFKAGFRMSSFSSGIKSQFISGISDKKVEDMKKDLFGFNSQIMKNPERTMKPFKCCALMHGGLCSTLNPTSAKADLGCKNLYTLLRAHTLPAEPKPLTLKATADDH